MKTVADLISELEAIEDKSLEVITAGDDEGNSYNSLYWSPTVMVARTDRMGWSLYNDMNEALDEDIDEDDLKYVVVL